MRKIFPILSAVLLFSCQNQLLLLVDQFYVGSIDPEDIRPPQLDDENRTSEDLSLAVIHSSGANISWDTSEHTNVAEDGKITRPDYTGDEVSGLIRADVTHKNGITQQFIYQVIVSVITPPDNIAVTAAAAAIEIGYQSGDSATSVTKNISLPASGKFSTNISWNASPHPMILGSGAVSNPHDDWWDGTRTVTADIIATVTKGSHSAARTFSLRVISAAGPVPTLFPRSKGYTDGGTLATKVADLELRLEHGGNDIAYYEVEYCEHIGPGADDYSPWDGVAPVNGSFPDSETVRLTWNMNALALGTGRHKYRVQLKRGTVSGPFLELGPYDEN